MVIMGGKDGTKAVRDLNVVNVGTTANPEYALLVTGDLGILTLRESFDESNLDDDVYTATGTYTRDVFGFSIINNNKEDSLTFTIDGKTVPVPPSTSFYDEFDVPDPFEIVVEGDDLDFDAYIKG
jgi:hypothetical protein